MRKCYCTSATCCRDKIGSIEPGIPGHSSHSPHPRTIKSSQTFTWPPFSYKEHPQKKKHILGWLCIMTYIMCLWKTDPNVANIVTQSHWCWFIGRFGTPLCKIRSALNQQTLSYIGRKIPGGPTIERALSSLRHQWMKRRRVKLKNFICTLPGLYVQTFTNKQWHRKYSQATVLPLTEWHLGEGWSVLAWMLVNWRE